MLERPSCVGCGETAPETNTNDTLISTAFGWRMTRHTQPSGEKVVEWRCQSCWREYKAPTRTSPTANAVGVASASRRKA
jgi:hypothetical protein